MEELVSVIIPAYNAEKSLSRTLDSLLDQDYKHLEIIVINDGSIDGTTELVHKYQINDSRIILINKENGGVSTARNQGINNATGKYLTFLDADDTFEINFVSSLLNQIQIRESDIAYCGFSFLTDVSRVPKKIKFSTKQVLKKYFLNQLPIHTSSWLIKKSYLDMYNIRFEEGVSWGEDIEFFTQVLSLSKNITFVDKYLSNYYIGDEDSLSAFTLDKIDLDYKSITRILNNDNITIGTEERSALIHYRLPALLTFRMVDAISKSYDLNEIRLYYEKYNANINEFKFNNGLRSIKLYLAIKKLEKLMR